MSRIFYKKRTVSLEMVRFGENCHPKGACHVCIVCDAPLFHHKRKCCFSSRIALCCVCLRIVVLERGCRRWVFAYQQKRIKKGAATRYDETNCSIQRNVVPPAFTAPKHLNKSGSERTLYELNTCLLQNKRYTNKKCLDEGCCETSTGLM